MFDIGGGILELWHGFTRLPEKFPSTVLPYIHSVAVYSPIVSVLTLIPSLNCQVLQIPDGQEDRDVLM